MTLGDAAAGGSYEGLFVRSEDQTFRMTPAATNQFRTAAGVAAGNGKYAELGTLGDIFAIRSVRGSYWEVEHATNGVSYEP